MPDTTIWAWLRGRCRGRQLKTHWSQVEPWLLIGPALDARGYAQIVGEGVTHIVDLRAERSDDPRAIEPLRVHWHSFPIEDGMPPTDDQFERLAKWWSEESAPGAVLYIHCEAGIQRSPTVAIALLLRNGLWPAEAQGRVAAAHPIARPSATQERWLQRVARSVRDQGIVRPL